MKKIFCLALSFLFSTLIFSQKIQKEDSIHLAELKMALPTATGTYKVDILNDLGHEYAYLKRFDDSSYKYIKLAYDEATKLKYKHGIALSLLFLPGDTATRRINRERAVQIATETNDHKVLGWYYYISGGNQPESFKRSVEEFRKGGFEEDEAEVSTWLTAILNYMGKYEESFPYAERNLILTKKKRTHSIGLQDVLVEASYNNIAELYKVAGDYQSALNFLHEARQYALIHKDDWNMSRAIAEMHLKLGNGDSALFYLKTEPEHPSVLTGRGEAYLLKKENDRALTLFDRAIDSVTMPRKKAFFWNNNGFFLGAYYNKAKAFAAKGDYATALKFINKSDEYLSKTITGSIDYKISRLKLYSDIYHGLSNNDSAFGYLNQYIVLKDSVDNKKMIWRLNMKLNSMKTAAIEAEKKANLALKEQKLQEQVLIKNGLAGGLLLLLLTGFFIFRNLHLKRKNEKLQMQKHLEVHKVKSEHEQTEFRRKAAELEMQALRAQMNPHFIFNCLSSINRFIIKNESKIASNYLTRFSRLIRMVLINSEKPMIALEEELQMLRHYLDMERLRFKDSFDYSITFLNTMDADNIFIPPLLLQPFCENAIWHGLMNMSANTLGKADKGHLNIELSMEDNILHCTITDNGIGREKAEEIKSKSAEKKKSLGLKITTERLALLNLEKGVNTFYEIEDLMDEEGNAAGTKVKLKISYKESVEEPA